MYPEWFDRKEQDKVSSRHFRFDIVIIPALWKPMQEDAHHSLGAPQTGWIPHHTHGSHRHDRVGREAQQKDSQLA